MNQNHVIEKLKLENKLMRQLLAIHMGQNKTQEETSIPSLASNAPGIERIVRRYRRRNQNRGRKPGRPSQTTVSETV
jgi:hypothetical protein